MAPPFKRRTFKEADEILNKYFMLLDGKVRSTNLSPSERPNEKGAPEAWWTENDQVIPGFDNPRSKAYLKAYVEIAGPLFYGTGIPLTKGLLHPDRAVMKAMLKSGCVTLGANRPGLFELTPAGRELIEGPAID